MVYASKCRSLASARLDGANGGSACVSIAGRESSTAGCRPGYDQERILVP